MDAVTDVLQQESRQWELWDKERSNRLYSEKNTMYWEQEVGEKQKAQITWNNIIVAVGFYQMNSMANIYRQ